MPATISSPAVAPLCITAICPWEEGSVDLGEMRATPGVRAAAARLASYGWRLVTASGRTDGRANLFFTFGMGKDPYLHPQAPQPRELSVIMDASGGWHINREPRFS